MQNNKILALLGSPSVAYLWIMHIWVSYLTSLVLIFLIWKMGIIPVLYTSQSYCEAQMRCYKQYSTNGRYLSQRKKTKK